MALRSRMPINARGYTKAMVISQTPTGSELLLLAALWKQGASTVREVHEAVVSRRRVGYTTTLKTLQIMMAKGLVVRSERGRFHLYRARYPARRIRIQLIRDLVDRAFEGSGDLFLAHALAMGRRVRPQRGGSDG